MSLWDKSPAKKIFSSFSTTIKNRPELGLALSLYSLLCNNLTEQTSNLICLFLWNPWPIFTHMPFKFLFTGEQFNKLSNFLLYLFKVKNTSITNYEYTYRFFSIIIRVSPVFIPHFIIIRVPNFPSTFLGICHLIHDVLWTEKKNLFHRINQPENIPNAHKTSLKCIRDIGELRFQFSGLYSVPFYSSFSTEGDPYITPGFFHGSLSLSGSLSKPSSPIV